MAAAIQVGEAVDAAARRITLAMGRDAVMWAAMWAVTGIET
jgi:hypothetical protein